MNWTQYSKILSDKVAEAYAMHQEADRKARQAKANYEAVVREQEAFIGSIKKDHFEEMV